MTETIPQRFTATHFIADTAEEIHAASRPASHHLGQTGPGTPGKKTFDAKTIFFLGLLLA